MSLSNYLENKILDKVLRGVDFTSAPVYIGLHTSDPGETGANEVSGGSYARQQVAASGWNAAASGQSDNIDAINFTNMPSCTVVALSLWDASSGGNCLWTGWLSTVVKAFVADDATNDIFRSPGHGFSDNDAVVFEAEDVGSLPTGISAGTIYYVVSATTDTFQVSATQGGAAVNYTAAGSGKVRKVTTKVINEGDTFQIPAGDLDVLLF